MKNASFNSSIAAILFSSSSAIAADCGDVSAKIQSDVLTIQNSYQNTSAASEQSFQQQLKSEQDNMPHPTSTEAMVNFKVDVKMKTHTFELHLPTVTMRDQKMSMDLPQITMKNQNWSFDVPETWMAQQCINGPFETVCGMKTKDIGFGIKTDIPECYTRAGKQICTNVPQFKMSRKDIVLGVPEVKMERAEWVMGVPEFKMELQTIKFDLPEFTIRDVKGSIKNAQDSMEKKSSDFKAAMEANAAKLKAEVEKTSAGDTISYLSCQKDKLVQNKNDILSKYDQGISIIKASFDKANEVHASDIAASLGAQLNDMVSKRKDAEQNIDKTISDFDNRQNYIVKSGIAENSSTVKVDLTSSNVPASTLTVNGTDQPLAK